MTRETKLGLVVGASFLSLVGVVGYTQWRKGDQPPAPPDTPAPAAQVGKANLPKDAKAPATIQSGVGQDPVMQPPKDAPSLPGSLPPTTPVPPPLGPSGTLPGAPSAPATPAPDPSKLPVSPAPVLPGFPNLPTPAPVGPAPINPGNEKPLVGGPGAPSAPLPPKTGIDLPPLTGFDGGKNPIPPGSGVAPLPDFPKPIDASVKNPTLPGIPPPGNPAIPPLSGLPSTVPGSAAIPPNLDPALKNDKLPLPPAVSGLGVIPDPKQPITTPVIPDATKPIDPKPAIPPLSVPPGTAPGAAGPAATVPPGNSISGVRTEQYVERKYVCEPTDIDFDALSKRFYNGSDRYAKALIEYNRDHPNGKEAVREAPRLKPGLTVWVPPLHVLESRYPQLVPSFRASTPDATKSQSPGVIPAPAMVPITSTPAPGVMPQPTSPFPVVPTSPGSGGVGPAAAAPPPPLPPGAVPPTGSPYGVQEAFKLYTVPPGGKRLSEIANETLGNPNLWGEILRLNTNIRQDEPVPAGTQLRLPPNARVGW